MLLISALVAGVHVPVLWGLCQRFFLFRGLEFRVADFGWRNNKRLAKIDRASLLTDHDLVEVEVWRPRRGLGCAEVLFRAWLHALGVRILAGLLDFFCEVCVVIEKVLHLILVSRNVSVDFLQQLFIVHDWV